jgi:hypothetical protein
MTVLGSTQPIFQSVPEFCSAGINRLDREAEKLPSSAEVKNEELYLTFPVIINAMMLN